MVETIEYLNGKFMLRADDSRDEGIVSMELTPEGIEGRTEEQLLDAEDFEEMAEFCRKAAEHTRE